MRGWPVALPASLAGVIAAAAPASAQDAAPATAAADATAAIAWDAPCGAPAAFVAGVIELGGSFEGYEVDVRVAPTDAGAFHGTLTIRREGAVLAERALDDTGCEDVADALVIAAALALRELPPWRGPGDPGPPRPEPDVAPPEPPPVPVAPRVPLPDRSAPRVLAGASVRGGLGPTPGPAIAPALIVALQIDRLLVALTFAYWPDSGAALADARGISLFALSTTLEAGYRIGDELGVVPCAVVEQSASFARGVNVERGRAEVSYALDAGLAVWLTLDLGDRVRLFARGDLLFGIVRPAYGVDGELVFAGPALRGTGGAGVLVIF